MPDDAGDAVLRDLILAVLADAGMPADGADVLARLESTMQATSHVPLRVAANLAGAIRCDPETRTDRDGAFVRGHSHRRVVPSLTRRLHSFLSRCLFLTSWAL